MPPQVDSAIERELTTREVQDLLIKVKGKDFPFGLAECEAFSDGGYTAMNQLRRLIDDDDFINQMIAERPQDL